MYCEYKIEIMPRNIVMTVLLLQNYQLLELQLDQMIGRLLSGDFSDIVYVTS
jgi:hypothetical protein